MTSLSHNRNPTGKNQHGGIPGADDPILCDALRKYHRERLVNNGTISSRLRSDHGIEMSASTVKRCRKEIGLMGSNTTMKVIDQDEAEQMILEEMDRDTAKRSGYLSFLVHPYCDQTQCFRNFVSDVMHTHDGDAFAMHNPTSKRIFRHQ
ncbi:hypothetical protein BDZ94DRAFT_1314366 [Collybia nuda]|uniref:Transposase n=1 Tax=Collybia nuda TaxID=64659 RepID=A0A9P5XXA2_9AGAR|nr:hypothetical protein BDZ94DRAFT_1314366 [Collybia nuda]